MADTKLFSGKNIALLAIEAFILIMLICKWMGVEMWYVETFSLWSIGGIVGEVNELVGGSFGLVLAAIIIYALLAATLVGIVLTVLSIIRSNGQESKVKLWGFLAPAALAVITILVVIVANIIVSAESDGYVDSLFVLTAVPFIVLILAAAGFWVAKKAPAAALDKFGGKVAEATSNVASSVSAGVSASAAAMRERKAATEAAKNISCPACGGQCAADAKFCPACGFSIPQAPAPRVCPICGVELPAEAVFCPSCGAKAE